MCRLRESAAREQRNAGIIKELQLSSEARFSQMQSSFSDAMRSASGFLHQSSTQLQRFSDQKDQDALALQVGLITQSPSAAPNCAWPADLCLPVLGEKASSLQPKQANGGGGLQGRLSAIHGSLEAVSAATAAGTSEMRAAVTQSLQALHQAENEFFASHQEVSRTLQHPMHWPLVGQ